MKSYTILSTGGSRTAKSEFEVHATGCRDIARKCREVGVESFGAMLAESPEALVEAEVEVYTYQDQGWNADDHRIFPCCAHAPEAVAK